LGLGLDLGDETIAVDNADLLGQANRDTRRIAIEGDELGAPCTPAPAAVKRARDYTLTDYAFTLCVCEHVACELAHLAVTADDDCVRRRGQLRLRRAVWPFLTAARRVLQGGIAHLELG
jgi:hypothetical protein